MSLEDTLGYEGGGFRRRRRPTGLIKPKPKVNKQALLRKQLMKHFGGFFNEMPDQEAPPPAMSPPPPGMEGGRRRRAKSPARSKSPVRRRVKAPVRRRRIGGESLPGVETATNIFGNYFADPSLQRIANTSSNIGSNTGDVFSKLSSGLMESTGGRKRRSASPKRRPVARRATSPKRRVARPVRRTF